MRYTDGHGAGKSARAFPAGTCTVTATPYPERDLGGTPGKALSVAFRVVLPTLSVADARALAPDEDFEPGSRLDAEVGYGFGGPAALGVLTPYAGLGLAGEGARTWRMGARWKGAPDATLSLEGARREAANDDTPEHGLMLRGTLRW